MIVANGQNSPYLRPCLEHERGIFTYRLRTRSFHYHHLLELFAILLGFYDLASSIQTMQFSPRAKMRRIILLLGAYTF